MDSASEHSGGSLPVATLLQIDKVCRRFEDAWKQGLHPKIEDYLGDWPEPERTELRCELSAIEAEYRRLPKEGPSLEVFVQHLTDSGLMTAEEYQAFLAGLPAAKRPSTAEQLAQQMYHQGKLTKFQAQAVYQGKTRGLVVGNYVVLDRLGKGGMGQVYKAKHRKMRRVVALKVLPSSATKSPEAVKRFQREVEAAAKLSHPHIVTAHDADEAKGIHFLVMEYVDGQDLASLVRERGTLAVSMAVDYLVQAARGLEYAHHQGVIHRDIKPSNLLVDKQGSVKVLDMGLARINEAVGALDSTAEEGLTETGQVMGTFDFMSPEQALETKTADARADVYSLGCTLYYLLCGRPPYRGDTVAKKIVAHREEPIPSLRAVREDVPESLDAVFRKMLAKKPEQRQQSMAEVIAELRQCTVPSGAAAGSAPASPPDVAETEIFRWDWLVDTAPERTERAPLAETFVHKPTALTERLLSPARTLLKRLGKGQKITIAVAVGLGFLAVLLGIIVKMKTAEGTLVVEISEPNVTVQVLSEEGKIQIERKGQKGTITISVDPGKHRLRVEKDGVELFAKEFTIASGGKETIRATFSASVAAGDSRPGEATVRADSEKVLTAKPGSEYTSNSKDASLPVRADAGASRPRATDSSVVTQLQKHLRGKVRGLEDGLVEITYDFSNPNQLEDWIVREPQSRWAIEDGWVACKQLASQGGTDTRLYQKVMWTGTFQRLEFTAKGKVALCGMLCAELEDWRRGYGFMLTEHVNPTGLVLGAGDSQPASRHFGTLDPDRNYRVKCEVNGDRLTMAVDSGEPLTGIVPPGAKQDGRMMCLKLGYEPGVFRNVRLVGRPSSEQPSWKISLGAAAQARAAEPQGAPAAPDRPDREWILLSWPGPGNSRARLWLFSPDAKTRVQITDGLDCADIAPMFSPDRRRIAFLRRQDASEARGTVWVCNLDGSGAAEVVGPSDTSEYFESPVWVSNSRIYFLRNPKYHQAPDGEIWQVDVDSRKAQMVFRIQDALHQGRGGATDISPDKQLLVMTLNDGSWAPTGDIYIADLQGHWRHTVWEDDPDDYRDDRALWSPDGKRIAWRHTFTKGAHNNPEYYGVGLARQGPGGNWTARLQPEQNTFITPLAWSPDSRSLLCARVREGQGATLFLMGDDFQTIRTVAELDTWDYVQTQGTFGRMADWAILPADGNPPTGN